MLTRRVFDACRQRAELSVAQFQGLGQTGHLEAKGL